KQTDFTIGVNCPSVPVVYIPQSLCDSASGLKFRVTNNIGVLAYAYTGTGDNATVLSGSGTVPGDNYIYVDISSLDPNETIDQITFTFTYTQGSNPECEVETIVSAIAYTNCANDLVIDLSDFVSSPGEFLLLTDGRFYPCSTPDANEIPFWSNFGNNLGIATLVSNGNQEFILVNDTACTDQQVADSAFLEAPGSRTLVANIGDLATE